MVIKWLTDLIEKAKKYGGGGVVTVPSKRALTRLEELEDA